MEDSENPSTPEAELPEANHNPKQNQLEKISSKEQGTSRIKKPFKLAALGSLAAFIGILGKGDQNASQQGASQPTTEPVAEDQIQVPSTETPSPTVPETTPPAPETTAPAENVYDQIKTNLEASSLSTEQKTQAEQILAELAQIQKNRGKFIQAYNSRQSENGEPLLLTLTRQKFEGIDPQNMPGFDPNNPNAPYEYQVPFLKDENTWQQQTVPQLEAIKSETDGQALLQKLQEISNANRNQHIYLESQTKSGTKVEVNVGFEAQSPDEQQNLQTTLAHIEQLKKDMPLFGNIQINVNNQNQNNSGYDKTTDTYIVNVAVENPAAIYPLKPYNIEHEFSHTLVVSQFPGQSEQDSSENTARFIRYKSPEDVVNLMINEAKIVTNPIIGRRFPGQTPTRFQILVLKKQLTSQDIGDLGNGYATLRYNEWPNYPEYQRRQRANVELIVQEFADVRSNRDRIDSDTAIDLLDWQMQLLVTP